MILATDAPLLDYQLARLARRAVHGLARTGAISRNSSGDFALAFSTANRIPRRSFFGTGTYALRSVEQFDINPLFEAAAEAVEEAIVNALFAAEDMAGRDDVQVAALPLGPTLDLLERHGRLFDPEPAAVHSR
jgi:D-aminopeptidase